MNHDAHARLTMSISVCIVEDNDRVRQGFADLIDRARGFRCLGQYATAEDALKHLPATRPDVVLMDIRLPRMSGVDCVRKLKAQIPDILVVMLTSYEDDDLIFQALKAGANGYLLKQIPPSDILKSIQEVHAGGAPMSSAIARKVIQSFHPGEAVASPTDALTPREREILRHLAKGYMNKEIADELGLSLLTVKVHVQNILSKLHVRSRTEAASRYLRQA
jgi:DNA-binding NarL/FixJ family response regulator